VTHYEYSTYNAFDNNPVFWADPSGADATTYTGDAAVEFGKRLQEYYGASSGDREAEGNDQTGGQITINDPQTPEGAYFSASVSVEAGAQSKQGTKFFGIGENIEIGATVEIARAELLIGIESDEVYLNLTLLNTTNATIVVGGHRVFAGGSIEFTYDPREGELNLTDVSANLGSTGSSFTNNGITNNIEFFSHSKTFLGGTMSFTAAVGIENIENRNELYNLSAAEGMGLSKRARDREIRIRLIRQQEAIANKKAQGTLGRLVEEAQRRQISNSQFIINSILNVRH